MSGAGSAVGGGSDGRDGGGRHGRGDGARGLGALTRRAVLASALVPLVARAAAPLSVYTVTYPLAYVAARLGGDAVAVTFPAPPGVDPEFWRPAIAVIAQYQRADLILLNGAEYAKWTTRASLPRAALVDTTRAVADRLIVVEGAVTHSHGPEGAHSHAAVASTTWLDFDLAAAQAAAVAQALAARLPAAGIEAALAGLSADLGALQARAAALAGRGPLVASHPRYQYFARASGLAIEAVSWQAGVLPDAEGWAGLDAILARHPARVLLWEAEPHPAAAAELARRGLAGVVFDICAQPPASGDFLSAMHGNLDRLAAALGA